MRVFNHQDIVNSFLDEPGVYLIEFPNGKKYVGLSKKLRRRMRDHFSQSRREKPNQVIDSALKKYGIENCHFRVLETSPVDKIGDLEAFWVNELNCTLESGLGYNINPGGEYTSNGVADSVRKKISEARKGVSHHTEYQIDRIRESNSTRLVSEETKKKIGQGNLGKKHTADWKAKASIRLKGKAFHTTEQMVAIALIKVIPIRCVETGEIFYTKGALRKSLNVDFVRLTLAINEKFPISGRNYEPLTGEERIKVIKQRFGLEV